MKYSVGDILKLKYNNTDFYDTNGNVRTHEMGEYFIIFSETPCGVFFVLSQKTKSLTEWHNRNIDYNFEKVK